MSLFSLAKELGFTTCLILEVALGVGVVGCLEFGVAFSLKLGDKFLENLGLDFFEEI